MMLRHITMSLTPKNTPTKRTSIEKPKYPFNKKKLFVDTNKLQE